MVFGGVGVDFVRKSGRGGGVGFTRVRDCIRLLPRNCFMHLLKSYAFSVCGIKLQSRKKVSF